VGGRLRLLVIGGSGFVGGAAVARLRALGHEVATFHRGEAADIRGNRRDLAAHRDAFARFGADTVVDTIAYTEADGASAVAAFRGIARRLVVLSSQDVYAQYGRFLGLETGAPDPAPAGEASALRVSRFPHRTAARPGEMAHDYEKILVERAAASDAALPATILRLPCVYGPGDPHHRVGQVLARMRGGEPFLLERAKAAWRWTRGYVEDVAGAIAVAATDPRATGRTYNVGAKTALGEAEWTRAIGRAAGWDGEVRAVAREELSDAPAESCDFAHDLAADTSRIRRELGYREDSSFEAGLRDSVDWERAHPIERKGVE
jgi:nucleoside-diphosphate-sugar epimerase